MNEISLVRINEFEQSLQEQFCKNSSVYNDAVPNESIFLFSYNYMDKIINYSEALIKKIFSMKIEENNLKKIFDLLEYSNEEIEIMSSHNLSKDIEISKMFSRSDFIISKNKMYFIETNVSSPLGGLGIADRYYEYVETSKNLLNKYKIQYYHPYLNWSSAISKMANKYMPSWKHEIVIACWENEYEENISDAYEAAYYLKKAGINTDIIKFEDLQVIDDHVYFKSKRIKVIYGATILSDLMNDKNKKEKYMSIKKCHDSNNVLYLTPMLSNIYGNKGIYALLSDSKYSNMFEEKLDLTQYIPWTRFLSYDKGLTNDLLKKIVSNREDYILKPQTSFGGKGIYIGKELKIEEWKDKIKECLGKNYVIQKFFDTDKFYEEGNNFNNYTCCFGSLVFDSICSGIFVRMSIEKSNMINISNGATFSVACKQYKE